MVCIEKRPHILYGRSSAPHFRYLTCLLDRGHITYNTVAKVVSILVDYGILKQTDKFGKAKIYSYTEYLDILRKDTY